MPKFTLYFGQDGTQLDPTAKKDAKEIAAIKKALPKNAFDKNGHLKVVNELHKVVN